MRNPCIFSLPLNGIVIRVYHIFDTINDAQEIVHLKYTDEQPEGIVLDSNNQLISGLLSTNILNYAKKYCTNKHKVYYFLLEEKDDE